MCGGDKGEYIVLDWNITAKVFGGGLVGTIELYPSVVFTIKKYIKWNNQGNQSGEYFNLGYSIRGNTSSKNFDTQSEVESYIEHQKELIPNYKILIEKCNALQGRIHPLEEKYSKYCDRIHELAKSIN